MHLHIDPDSAVPLFHQIAEAVHYRIATGDLPTGTQLPALRQAAESWGVNLHTVGRAYRELRERGLVESAGRNGTRVVQSAGASSLQQDRGAVDDFVFRFVREARERHGLLLSDLVRILRSWPGNRPRSVPTVHVVECSRQQCLDHCEEIETRWNVHALPWILGSDGEPPAGPIIATYFHYQEVRRLWPHRSDDIRFVVIRPDPNLFSRVAAARHEDEAPSLLLCEFDEPMAVNTVAELATTLPPDRFPVRPAVVETASERLGEATDSELILFPPRIWARLTPEERNDPRAIHLRFFIEPTALDSVGEEFDWHERGAARVA